jgi:hypothetical protein
MWVIAIFSTGCFAKDADVYFLRDAKKYLERILTVINPYQQGICL